EDRLGLPHYLGIIAGIVQASPVHIAILAILIHLRTAHSYIPGVVRPLNFAVFHFFRLIKYSSSLSKSSSCRTRSFFQTNPLEASIASTGIPIWSLLVMLASSSIESVTFIFSSVISI